MRRNSMHLIFEICFLLLKVDGCTAPGTQPLEETTPPPLLHVLSNFKSRNFHSHRDCRLPISSYIGSLSFKLDVVHTKRAQSDTTMQHVTCLMWKARGITVARYCDSYANLNIELTHVKRHSLPAPNSIVITTNTVTMSLV